MIRLWFTLLILATLGGCAPKLDDLETYAEDVHARSVVNIEPYPEFETQPAYEYTASTLRSPFVRPKNKQAPPKIPSQLDCLQPNPNRMREKLESYGLDALEMSGSFIVNNKTWALITSNDGTLHRVSTGNYVGLFHGEITRVTNTTIYITQLLPDGTGCWQTKETTMTTLSATGETNG